ncbi:MAG TPA: FAD-dependent oxidoreductase [Armatimonadetes bacterium]|jgi:hypothetical protein|nr:FAD-dependent oxidoreductase [Armatimonadota bacterium]
MADPADIYRSLPIAHRADVVVIGGGPAGFGAAVAAAEEGADTLLIERWGFLGGTATAGGVNPFMRYMSGEVVVNAGVFGRVLEALDERGARGGRDISDRERRQFDPEVLKILLDEMALAAGARLLLHSFMVEAVASDGRVERAVIANKSGLQAVEADLFIDASGDADLAARAGAEFEMGRDEDGLCQPMSLFFRTAGVDTDRLPTYEQINELYRPEKAAGRIDNPRDDVHGAIFTTHPGEITHNATRILAHDGTDAVSLTDAELQGRRQIRELMTFFKDKVPGFENACIGSIAAQVGVRETRRVIGDYVLTRDDFEQAAKFEDAVARGCFSIDIHSPTGHGLYGQRMPEGDWYDIPYRCLTPKGVDNLLVAGRPISCDHYIHGSLRVMPIAMSTGEAAGVAAAMAAADDLTTRGVDVAALRERLRARGASV